MSFIWGGVLDVEAWTTYQQLPEKQGANSRKSKPPMVLEPIPIVTLKRQSCRVQNPRTKPNILGAAALEVTQFAPPPSIDSSKATFRTVAMPTPESAAFLAKKPTVPPTFDGVDYDDTKRLKQAQDAIIREQWVQVMMGRLVREEMSKCYYREGVNHLEKCGHLRGALSVQWPTRQHWHHSL